MLDVYGCVLCIEDLILMDDDVRWLCTISSRMMQ